MTASVRAAVLRAPHTPLAVETLELADPGPGEVRVRYGASGVCHSDLHCIDGEWTVPLPLVLGHEGAGTVEAVGPGVGGLAPRRYGRALVALRLRPLPRLPAGTLVRLQRDAHGRLHARRRHAALPRRRGHWPLPVPLGRNVRRGRRRAGLCRRPDPRQRPVRGRLPDRLLGHDGRGRGRQYRAGRAWRIGRGDRLRRRRPLGRDGRGARRRASDHRHRRRGRKARPGARSRRNARRAGTATATSPRP